MQPPPRHVDIDAHGRLVARDDGARSTLADRAGRFVLLPSAPDLLVARRTPAAGGEAPPARCVLAGDTSAFPIADLIAFVHQSKLSGLLTVSTGGLDRAVAFRDGEVRGATSQAEGERVGEVALRLGYLDRDQLAAAVEAARDKLFGKVLIERGLLSPTELWKCLHEQVAGVFHAILLTREGVFTMVDEPDLDLGTPLSVNTQSLLMDGIRRIDEMSLFRARIPGPEAFLRRREPRVAVTLRPTEQSLLDLVDGRRRVAEIAQGAHLSEFDATKILYHLAEAGYVEAVTAAGGPGGSHAERLGAIASAMNAVLQQIAATIAAQPGALDAFLTGARTFLSDPASPFAPLFRALAPARDGTIDAATLLGNLAALDGRALAKFTPAGEPGPYLFAGMRELMFFYLFQTSGRLPRDADERLANVVREHLAAVAELQ